MQIVLWTIGIYFINTYNRIVLQMQRNRTQKMPQNRCTCHLNVIAIYKSRCALASFTALISILCDVM